jgi:DNA-binding PadR family transcriptional regulator
MPESFERNALTEAVFYILLSMHEPMHGYAVMQNIEKISSGRVILGAGTLYGAINTLLEKRWIEGVSPDKNSRKKEYIITEIGKRVVRGEINRLEELLINGKNIAGGDR